MFTLFVSSSPKLSQSNLIFKDTAHSLWLGVRVPLFSGKHIAQVSRDDVQAYQRHSK